jgi:predicted hydrolase (HD superfamily)
MITKPEALELLDEHVRNAKKKRHSLAIGAIMKELAKKLSIDEEEWELVGLLHDLDCEMIGGDMRRHGLVAAEMLEGRLPEEGLHAIRAHDYRTAVKPESKLDKALIAADCVWILIARVAFVTSHGKVDRIKHFALRNAFKSKSFPPFLKSGILMCRDFGLSLEEFLDTALNALPGDLIIDKEDL